MLAGLFEFPAIDLAPEDSPLKASARSLRLDKLVRSLIDTSDCLLRSPEDASAGALVSRTALPTVTQVYSHITRTYLAERVVLSSSSLPPLRPASKQAPADSTAVVQSRAGAAKWIPASQVGSANVGGAVGKIWDERNSLVNGAGGGGGGGGGGKKVGRNGKKSGNKGKNGSTAAAPEKGQASLAGFFIKKGPSEPRPPPPPSPSAKHELAVASAVTAEDDDVVIVEATAVTGSVAEAKVRTALKSSPVKVYKKRRIASDSEDD